MRRNETIIALAGGGTGGHLYPLLAVADEITRQSGGAVRLVYIAPSSSYDEEFSKRGIRIYPILHAKLRRYGSLQNILDIPKLCMSFIHSLMLMYSVMPDVVFSKGGPGAFPVVMAARCYRIPVMIHESDAVPGLTNRLSSPFATRIGITFPNAAAYFPKERTALVGTPIRAALMGERETNAGAKRALGFDPEAKLLVVLGGSQGAARINQFIVDNLEALLGTVQIFHQTGSQHFEEVERLAGATLAARPGAHRYKATAFMDVGEMRRALAAADVVLTRSGASALSEIALFEKPAILVPLPEAASDHQRRNAYSFSSTGAATVVEEGNLTPHIVCAELERLIGIGNIEGEVRRALAPFIRPEAARVIAQELLQLSEFQPPRIP